MQSYHTSFFIADNLIPWFLILFLVFGLGGMFLGMRLVSLRLGKKLPVMTYVVLAWMGIIVLLVGYRYYKQHSDLESLYEHGMVSVVEGQVKNFRPMPYTGHSDETFQVDSIVFSYSDFRITPCFHNSSSHGGPIREGLRVRVSYSDNCILKLEVQQNPPESR